MNSAELAAAFIYKWLPWIKSKVWTHRTEDKTTLLQMRRAACEELVMKLQLPPSYFVYLHVPFLAALDGDKRHKHVLMELSRPRDREGYAQFKQRKLQELLTREQLWPLPPVLCTEQPQESRAQLNTQIAMFDLVLSNRPSAAQRAEAEASREAAKAKLTYWTREQIIDDVLEQYKQREGHGYYAYCLWCEAQVNPAFCCVTALNWLPWSANSPEINQVAEHMVGTLSNFGHQIIADHRTDFKLLKQGKTILGYIAAAVEQRGNGPDGLWHIQRSLEKLPCTLELLAKDAGTECQLQYIFQRWRPYRHANEEGETEPDPGRTGHPVHDSKKRSVHTVKATGGKWISERRWT